MDDDECFCEYALNLTEKLQGEVDTPFSSCTMSGMADAIVGCRWSNNVDFYWFVTMELIVDFSLSTLILGV